MTLSEKVARILERVCAGEIEKAGVPVGTVSGNYRKVSDNPPKWEWIMRKNPPKSDVKHDGEYVLTKSGSKDFGEITPEVAKIIGRQAGKIRLETGFHNNSTGQGFGESHIERKERLAQLKQNGFDSARDFVESVSKGYDSIYKGKGTSIILCMNDSGRKNVEYLELKPSSDGDYWSVESALISRADYLNEKTPLWSKSKNGVQQSEKGRAQSSQFPKESPSAISGISDSFNIPAKSGVVKKAFIHNGRLYIHKSWLNEIKESFK